MNNYSSINNSNLHGVNYQNLSEKLEKKENEPPETKDSIKGTDKGDLLFAKRSGSDIYGFRGEDRIVGGPGNDSIWGGKDNDTIWTGHGNNKVATGLGSDTVYGGAGNDQIETTGSYNQILDSGGDNTLTLGGKGDSAQLLGNGNNQVLLSQGGQRVITGKGNDVFGIDFTENHQTAQIFTEGGDNDFLNLGAAGHVQVSAGSGDDYFSYTYPNSDPSSAPSFSDYRNSKTEIWAGGGNNMALMGPGEGYYESGVNSTQNIVSTHENSTNVIITEGNSKDAVKSLGNDEISTGGNTDQVLVAKSSNNPSERRANFWLGGGDDVVYFEETQGEYFIDGEEGKDLVDLSALPEEVRSQLNLADFIAGKTDTLETKDGSLKIRMKNIELIQLDSEKEILTLSKKTNEAGWLAEASSANVSGDNVDNAGSITVPETEASKETNKSLPEINFPELAATETIKAAVAQLVGAGGGFTFEKIQSAEAVTFAGDIPGFKTTVEVSYFDESTGKKETGILLVDLNQDGTRAEIPGTDIIV